MKGRMDVGAINAAAAASAATYRSFADATRSVLDLLERLLPGCALYLAHLDRTHSVHRIVDTRGGEAFGLRCNLSTPLGHSYDIAMADERAPRLCNELARDPIYGGVGMQRRAAAGSYLGVPLELSDGSRVGALAALSAQAGRFRDDDEQTLRACSPRVLAYELERESNERDLKRLNDSLRDPRPRHGRDQPVVSRAGRRGGRARRASAARRARWPARPSAFLPRAVRREFVSTAMSGVRCRRDDPAARRDHRPRVHRARELLRARRAQATRRLRGRSSRRRPPRSGAVRAGAPRRRGLRRADRDLAAARSGPSPRACRACCGCSRPRPP
jgi:hypothetical protein